MSSSLAGRMRAAPLSTAAAIASSPASFGPDAVVASTIEARRAASSLSSREGSATVLAVSDMARFYGSAARLGLLGDVGTRSRCARSASAATVADARGRRLRAGIDDRRALDAGLPHPVAALPARTHAGAGRAARRRAERRHGAVPGRLGRRDRPMGRAPHPGDRTGRHHDRGGRRLVRERLLAPSGRSSWWPGSVPRRPAPRAVGSSSAGSRRSAAGSRWASGRAASRSASPSRRWWFRRWWPAGSSRPP